MQDEKRLLNLGILNLFILFFVGCAGLGVKTIFVPKTIIQTIILGIIKPIECAIWIYFGIYIVNKIKKNLEN